MPSSDKRHTLSCLLVFDASTLILLAKPDLLDLFLEDFEGSPRLPGALEAESTGSPGLPDGVLIRQRITEGRLRVEEVGQPNVIARLARDFRLGAGVRDLIARGRLFLALERYREGKASLGKAAEMAGVSVSEMMDFLAENGAPADLTVEDYRESLLALREIW